MLGAIENIFGSGLLRTSQKLVNSKCCVLHQSVRHFPRKPRWVPMAKSKTYIVIDKKVQPRMEKEEYEVLFEKHELYNRSLWAFQREISRETELREQREAKQISEEVELERMMKINDAENERVRKIREAAKIEEWKLAEEEIIKLKQQREEKELAKLEETEKHLQLELERVKHAIKLEDLDEVIEKALAVQYDYCYGVNKKGQYVVGRLNASNLIDGPAPTAPMVKPVEIVKEIERPK